MATVNFLPNQSYFPGVRPYSELPSAFPSNGSAQSGALMLQPSPSPLASPAYAQGVTGLQSESANEMTGGLETAVEHGGTLTSAAGDGFASTQRGAAAAAGGAADAASGAANAAGGAADGARSAASAAGGAADAARGAGRFLGPAAIGIDLVSGGLKIRDAWKDPNLTDSQRDQKVGEATVGTAGSIAGGAGGAWAGAAAGAAIGSVVPVVGTVIGGIAGAVLGGFLGGKAGEKAGEAVGGTGAGKGIGGFINNLFGK